MFRRNKNRFRLPRHRSLFGRQKKQNAIIFKGNTLRRSSIIQNRTAPSTSEPVKHVVIRQKLSRPRSPHRLTLLLSNALLAFSIAIFWPAAMSTVNYSRNQIWGIDQQKLKQVLAGHLEQDQMPTELLISGSGQKRNGQIHYTLDEKLQNAATAGLQKYRPDYGMIVAMDAVSGEILAMTDFQRDGNNTHNLNLKATYPAASVFKTITAAAAIDLGKATATTVFPYNGKSTTLYKKNVLSHKNNKWTNHQSLTRSFSKSVNTVFARLGIYTVGGKQLLNYANRFAFNQPLNTDLPIEPSTIEMDINEDWSIAEVASGYTRNTNISPVHGAMLAATIVNNGKMPMPRVIDAVTDDHGIILYEADPPLSEQVISAETASEMRELMHETIVSGSARKAFRKFKHKSVKAGGKTGSLTGFHPKGKYDWFVGYATDGDRKLAYAVLCINKDFWYVKSSQLARDMIDDYISG